MRLHLQGKAYQKRLKNVSAKARYWLRGTSLPDRSPEGGAVKVSLAFARAYLQDGCSFWDKVTTRELGCIYDT